MILILLKMLLQMCLVVLILSIFDSDTNTSGQHFHLYKVTGSQG